MTISTKNQTTADPNLTRLFNLEERPSAYRLLMSLPQAEKARRFEEMVTATFSHIDGRDLLKELHPRRMLDIKRRVDGREAWFEGDWLSDVYRARDGENISEWRKIP